MNRYIKIKAILICLAIILLGCSEEALDNFDTGTLTGTVVERGTNVPLENVKISTNPNTSTVFTDTEGQFIIENIPVEDYSVQAELEGYLTTFEGAEITSGSTINVIFELDEETANNRPPSTPILITPSDNAVDIPLTTTLVWSGSDPDGDDITYTIELRNDADEEVLSFSTVNDTLIEVSGLRFGLKYFWQVGAADDINAEIIQSEVSAFNTIPFPDNRYVFVREMNGNNVIFSTNENGDELMLTSANSNSFRPRQNTVIEKIAFLSNSGSETHIFTMDEDGSNINQVTQEVPINGFKLEEMDFAWTQNGEKLIYSNFNRLYSINLNGEGLEQIYETADGSLISEVAISQDESIIVLKTNDVNGYNVNIYTINANTGNIVDNILNGVAGAAGGLDISVDNQSVLYWYDVSGFESSTYRQLNSRIFLFDRNTSTAVDLSDQRPNGTNDFDCRFTPNEAEIIFTNTSNDGVSQKNIVIADINPNSDIAARTTFIEDAKMIDYE